MTIFVLWILMTGSSYLYGVEIGPGWVAKAVMWDREACDLAIENGKSLNPSGKIFCLPAGEDPPGPVAKQLPRGSSNQDNNKENHKEKEELKELKQFGALRA